MINAVLNEKWDAYANKYFVTWCVAHLLYLAALLITCIHYLEEDLFLWTILVVAVPGGKMLITSLQMINEIRCLIREHGYKRGMDIYFQWFVLS